MPKRSKNGFLVGAACMAIVFAITGYLVDNYYPQAFALMCIIATCAGIIYGTLCRRDDA